MGFFSKVEGKMEDTVEGAADRMGGTPLSPVQIAKKAEKQMRREKMVGAGKQYAPTLYTVLVNADDDRRLLGYYPTLAGETETYLSAKAAEQGLVMDGQPLVRFIVDDGLKHGKFDIIAQDEDSIAFVQVKGRDGRVDGFGFDEATMERDDFERMSMSYLAENPDICNCAVRLDVVAITVVGEDRAMIRHHINAMNYGLSEE